MYIRKRVNVNACFYCLCFGEMFVSTKSKLVYDPTLQTITYTWKYFIEFLDHSFILTQASVELLIQMRNMSKTVFQLMKL